MQLKLYKFIKMRLLFVALSLSLFLFSCHKSSDDKSLGYDNPYDQLAEQNTSGSAESSSWTSWIGSDTIGVPYIADFSSAEQFDKFNYAIEQDVNGIMLIANRKGLLAYDGKEWNMVKTKHYVLGLKRDPYSGHILAGCRWGFGLVSTDAHGLYHYSPISPEASRNNFTEIACFQHELYFYSNSAVYIYSRTDSSKKYLHQAPSGSKFFGSVAVGERFFVNIDNLGLYEIKASNSKLLHSSSPNASSKLGTIVEFAEQTDLEGEEILFSIPFSKKAALFGASNNKLYLFDGSSITPFNCDASNFLKTASIQGAVNMSDDEFAVSTLNGGCVVINKKTKKTVLSLNYQTGLPDDEIQAIGVDRSKGLWLSMPNSLSRVNFGLHVKNYSALPGLEGKLLSVSEVGSSVYAGTTSGVYQLYELKDIKEVTKYIKKKLVDSNSENEAPALLSPQVKKENFMLRAYNNIADRISGKSASEPQNADPNQGNAEKETVKEKKSWLAKLFKKSKPKEQADNSKHDVKSDLKNFDNEKKQADEQNNAQNVKPVVKHSSSSKSASVVVEKQYTYHSIKYAFRKVSGISDRCKSFYYAGDKLLVCGNTGAYEVIGDKSIQIVKDRYIHSVYQSDFKPDVFYFCSSNGMIEMINRNGKWEATSNFDELSKPIYSVVEQNDHTLWLGSENLAYEVKTDLSGKPIAIDPFTVGNRYVEPIYIRKGDHQILFYTESGIYKLNNKSIQSVKLGFDVSKHGLKYLFSQKNCWVNNGSDWFVPYKSQSKDSSFCKYFNAFDRVVDVFVTNKPHFWLVDKSKNMYKVKTDGNDVTEQPMFDVFLKTISYDEGKYIDLNELSVDFDKSSLKFNILAPYYLKDNCVKYQYRVEGKGFSGQWTNWLDESNIKFPFLPSGKFKLIIRAKNLVGNISQEKSFYFSVRPPFWETWWFYSLIFLVVAYSVYRVIQWRTSALEKDKKILEEKVLERTAEIEEQKQEIQRQHTEIKNSIDYASLIQKAALPNKDVLEGLPINNFIYFQPKDVVSGDYYWFTRTGNKLIITAADCTGHGVPGGFLSMLGMAFLNDIVVNNKVSVPGDILDQLREKVINQLNHTEVSVRDGMDISLCAIDFDTKKLWFAGAYNPIFIVRNGKLTEVKADRMPIGLWVKSDLKNFSTQCIDLQSNDTLYLCSDGYCDQFGGPKGRKFLPVKFREMLLTMNRPNRMNMSEQFVYVQRTMELWMKGYEQVDDMMVIGLHIK